MIAIDSVCTHTIWGKQTRTFSARSFSPLMHAHSTFYVPARRWYNQHSIYCSINRLKIPFLYHTIYINIHANREMGKTKNIQITWSVMYSNPLPSTYSLVPSPTYISNAHFIRRKNTNDCNTNARWIEAQYIIYKLFIFSRFFFASFSFRFQSDFFYVDVFVKNNSHPHL